MTRLLWVILLCLLVPEVMHSRDRLTGLVTDDTGEPLPGVVIKAYGSNSDNRPAAFGISDSQGRYALSIPDGTVITHVDFALIGYRQQSTRITSQSECSRALNFPRKRHSTSR